MALDQAAVGLGVELLGREGVVAVGLAGVGLGLLVGVAGEGHRARGDLELTSNRSDVVQIGNILVVGAADDHCINLVLALITDIDNIVVADLGGHFKPVSVCQRTGIRVLGAICLNCSAVVGFAQIASSNRDFGLLLEMRSVGSVCRHILGSEGRIGADHVIALVSPVHEVIAIICRGG